MNINLKPGDVFATENPQALGWIINKIQKWNSRDNESSYSHAGIIVNENGDTIESLWTVSSTNIFITYAEKRIIIARYLPMKGGAWAKSFAMLRGHLGQSYPWWRLPLHVVPPLAKYLSFTGMPVCSELTAKHLHLIEARHKWWTGTNPDTLVDEWRRWKGFEIIYEDFLPKPTEV